MGHLVNRLGDPLRGIPEPFFMVNAPILADWGFGPRADHILENRALRQQLFALHTQRPRRRLTMADKLLCVGLRRP
jgi:hypothetical protein